MMLSVSKSSIFFFISHNCVTVTLTCIMLCDLCDITSHLLSKSKIKKNKIKTKENKMKPSLLFTILIAMH